MPGVLATKRTQHLIICWTRVVKAPSLQLCKGDVIRTSADVVPKSDLLNAQPERDLKATNQSGVVRTSEWRLIVAWEMYNGVNWPTIKEITICDKRGGDFKDYSCVFRSSRHLLDASTTSVSFIGFTQQTLRRWNDVASFVALTSHLDFMCKKSDVGATSATSERRCLDVRRTSLRRDFCDVIFAASIQRR